MKLKTYGSIKKASAWGVTEVNTVNAEVLNTISDSRYFVSKKDTLKIESHRKGNKGGQKYGLCTRYMLDKPAPFEKEKTEGRA